MAVPYTGPDLATILQNLSAYTTPASQPPSVPLATNQQNPYEASPYIPEDGEIDEYEPLEHSNPQSSPLTASVNASGSAHQQVLAPQALNPQKVQTAHQPSSALLPHNSSISSTSSQSSQPPIITWPAALRHITTLSARNPSFIPRIKQLILSQHDHERQWWRGREQLLLKIQGREASRRKLQEALAAVTGGNAGGDNGTLLSADDAKDGENGKRKLGDGADELGKEGQGEIDAEGQKELLMYDRKVLRACKDMAKATEMELENMGVPFFGATVEKLVGKEEREKLKAKMLRFLEDLAGE